MGLQEGRWTVRDVLVCGVQVISTVLLGAALPLSMILLVFWWHGELADLPAPLPPARSAEQVQAAWDARREAQEAAGVRYLRALGLTVQGQVICTGEDAPDGALCNAMTREVPVPLVFHCGTAHCMMHKPVRVP